MFDSKLKLQWSVCFTARDEKDADSFLMNSLKMFFLHVFSSSSL